MTAPKRSEPSRALRAMVVQGRGRAGFDDAYHALLGAPWWQFVLACLAAWVGLNALFALAYRLLPVGSVAAMEPRSFEHAFYFSVQTMATIGYGGMTPVSRAAHFVVTLEAFVGMLLTALVTGATFARVARPTARILFADKAVISKRDGVPHLVFRMANWRHNNVVEAQLRVMLLLDHRTAEGETMRVPVELPLVRDRSTFFILTWMAMHKVDASSPFFGPDALEKLRARRAELFLSLTGYDETFAATIHARKQYSLDDVVLHARFADVLSMLPDGTRVLDYTNFHAVLPVEGE